MASQEVGSMDVVMNYKDNGLKKGMDDSKKDFKEAKQSGKSMNQEMSRLSAVSVATGQAIFQVAAGLLNMFKAGLTSSPYLIGAFTRMKTDVTILFWKLTKHLKPAFDLLADAIHMLTTGDWKGFIQVAGEAWDKFKEIVSSAWNWLIRELDGTWIGTVLVLIGDLAALTAEAVSNMATWIAEYDWAGQGLWQGIIDAMTIVWNKLRETLLPEWVNDIIDTIGIWLANNQDKMSEYWRLLLEGVPWTEIGKQMGEAFWQGFKNAVFSFPTFDEIGQSLLDKFGVGGSSGTAIPISSNKPIAIATGMYVPSDGMYMLHAGENVQPAGTYGGNSGGGNATNITIDFSGSNISLGDDMDLDKFANVVSQKIADEQAWRAY